MGDSHKMYWTTWCGALGGALMGHYLDDGLVSHRLPEDLGDDRLTRKLCFDEYRGHLNDDSGAEEAGREPGRSLSRSTGIKISLDEPNAKPRHADQGKDNPANETSLLYGRNTQALSGLCRAA